MSKTPVLVFLVGLVFLFLDVRYPYEAFGLAELLPEVKGVELDLLLPDFMGYALVVVALKPLAVLDRRFRVARVLAAILVVVSVSDLVLFRRVLDRHGDMTYYYDPLWFADVASKLGELAVIWFGVGGLKEVAVRQCRFNVGRPLEMARNLYVTLGLFELADLGVTLVAPYWHSYYAIALWAFRVLAIVLVVEALLLTWWRLGLPAPEAE